MFLEKLITIGTVLSKNEFLGFDVSHKGDLVRSLSDFLMKANGLVVFESSLVVRPGTLGEHVEDIQSWNRPMLWKYMYKDTQLFDIIFFAEDAFGNQYGINQDYICFFNLETGCIDHFCDTLEEWAKILLEDYFFHTGYGIMHQWQVRFGKITLGYRLCPKLPVILGGEMNINNFQSSSLIKNIEFLSSIATQIRDIPDGAQIKICIEE
ncbi:MAG: SMI1/KNR4 family protein [Planctomycetaceae bacterium]|jgi:hypothetical protein|nr:SMI1/KNR4 family protein [Planctomycetaceae bacterium]